MVMQLISEIGPWFWFVVGLLLLIGEVMLPGAFLVWFGLSALTIGTLTLTGFADVAWWPWQVQLVAFGVLSGVLAMVGRKLFPNDRNASGEQEINDPLGRLLGSEATLDDPIENGVGRVKLGDTIWRLKGPDLPAGTRVKVTGSDGGALVVEAI